MPVTTNMRATLFFASRTIPSLSSHEGLLSTQAFFQLLSTKEQLGPVFILSCFFPAKVKFPLLPWREARKFLTACDPAILSTIIEEFSSTERPSQEMVNFYVRFKAAEEAAEVLAQLEAQPPRQPVSRRNASTRLLALREWTDLKYLGATKLLDYPRSAPDAIVLTTDTAGPAAPGQRV